MSVKYKKLIISFYLSAAVAIFVGGAFWLGFFNTWQTKLTDKLFLKSVARGDIVILAIDDASLKELGQWPWPRATHAQAVLNLAVSQPKIVGYDVIFSEPSRLGASDDESLARALSSLPVVLPVEAESIKLKKDNIPQAEKIIESIKVIKETAKYFGQVNVVSDEDGIVRRLPFFVASQNQQIPSLSLRLASFASGQNPEEITGVVGNWLRINFIGPPGSFKTVSFKDVYSNNFLATDFKNKIVLVGVTSADLHDQQMTPFSLGQAMAGVEIHANAVQTILDKKFISEVGQLNVLGFIFLFSLVNALSFSFLRRIWMAVLAGLILFSLYLMSALFLFGQGTILNLVYPFWSFIFSLVVILLYRYFSADKEKSYLRQSFQFYLAPGVVEEIIKNPASLKLGGQKKDMTVLFSDIRGFTTLSERTEPVQLVTLLNEYFTAMTEVILQTGGVLDKFIGDAIMAFWGAPQQVPNHAQLACEAALKMTERLAILKKDWARRGLPEINIGIGLNSGEMVVGNIGSTTRFNYTVIGDNVNLSSRLEGLNKQYQASIIISQFTYERVKDSFVAEFLDKVTVKGKEIPVDIYSLIGKKS